MNPIQVNCPECQKLYLVRPDDLTSGNLTFQCQDCHSYFGFSWPQPPGTQNVKAAKIVDEKLHPGAPAAVASGPTRTCMKCGAKIDSALTECPKCGIILERAKKGRGPDPATGTATEEVIAAWEAVKTNYGDEKRHESFIQLCLSRDNLPFASSQYRTVLSANPTEEIARRMQDRIVNLATTAYIAAQTTQRENTAPRFKKTGLMVTFIAVIFIVVGLTSPALRPMTAIGLAIFAFLFVLRTLNKT